MYEQEIRETTIRHVFPNLFNPRHTTKCRLTKTGYETTHDRKYVVSACKNLSYENAGV